MISRKFFLITVSAAIAIMMSSCASASGSEDDGGVTADSSIQMQDEGVVLDDGSNKIENQDGSVKEEVNEILEYSDSQWHKEYSSFIQETDGQLRDLIESGNVEKLREYGDKAQSIADDIPEYNGNHERVKEIYVLTGYSAVQYNVAIHSAALAAFGYSINDENMIDENLEIFFDAISESSNAVNASSEVIDEITQDLNSLK